MAEYMPSTRDWVREQVEVYEGSGGTEGTTLRDTGLPVIIVTNRGNQSGAIRKTPLMRVKDGNNYVLVASMGGAPNNPVWVYNLRADNNVEIRDETDVYTMRVREVQDDAERARLWDIAVEAFPPYEEYQGTHHAKDSGVRRRTRVTPPISANVWQGRMVIRPLRRLPVGFAANHNRTKPTPKSLLVRVVASIVNRQQVAPVHLPWVLGITLPDESDQTVCIVITDLNGGNCGSIRHDSGMQRLRHRVPFHCRRAGILSIPWGSPTIHGDASPAGTPAADSLAITTEAAVAAADTAAPGNPSPSSAATAAWMPRYPSDPAATDRSIAATASRRCATPDALGR